MQRRRSAMDDHQIKLMNSKELISHKNKQYSRIKKRNNSILNKQMLHSLQQHFSKSIEIQTTNIFLEFRKNYYCCY